MEARRHLEERVDAFPVACFPNTIEGSAWSGLRRTSSKETLGTIFSVGSLEVREERNWKERMMEKLPAVPPIERIAEMEVERKPVQARPKVEENRRNTYQPEPAPTPTPIPAQRYRRKSLQPQSPYQQQIPMDRSGRQTQAQRDSEFENNLSSYDNISTSLGRSPYELANSMFSRDALAKPDVKERAKSMTAQFEAEAAARFAASRQNQTWNQRNMSNESTSTVVVHASRSYESIPTYSTPSPSGNMSGYGAGTVEEVIKERRKSRERPPPAHAKFANSPALRSTPPPRAPSSTPPPRSVFQEPGHISSQMLGQEDEVGMRRMSMIGARTSSKPPVSMTTQRKAVPSLSPSPPERTAPRPPILKVQTETQPAPQKRKPVQTRRSMEIPSGPQQYISYASPSSARQSFDHSLLQQQLKQQQQTKTPTQVQVQEQGRFSWQRQQGNGNAIARPASASARPSLDYQNARPHNLRAGVSFDTSQQQQQNQKLWAGQQPESYDHTYGSSYPPPRPSSTPTRSFQQHQHAPEEEYYDAPRQDWDEREGEERVLKERRISGSTSEMLRLDLPLAIPTARANVVSPLPEKENQTLRERKEELKRKERERAMVVRDSGYASPAQGPVGYGYVTGYSPAGRRVQVGG
jgi:hypothetical protein